VTQAEHYLDPLQGTKQCIFRGGNLLRFLVGRIFTVDYWGGCAGIFLLQYLNKKIYIFKALLQDQLQPYFFFFPKKKKKIGSMFIDLILIENKDRLLLIFSNACIDC